MENSSASGSELWDTTDSEDDSVEFSDDKPREASYLPKKGKDTKSSFDSGDLSDIKDAEVDSYLNNEKQKHYKKIIWEMMNQKYLDDQEAQRKMAASNISNPKTKQRNKTAKDGKKPALKTQPTASKKRPSTRINYDALQKMFEEEPVVKENTKRARTESESAKGRDDDDDDSELGEYNENEERNGWEENTGYSHYNDQDDDYYYDDGEDLF